MTSANDHSALVGRSTIKTVMECVFMSFLFLTALIGNVFVCLAFYKNPTLHRSLNNYFIISLAVSDILMALLVEPLTIGALATGGWPFGDVFCQFHGVCMYIVGLASLMIMMVISVNRYFKMVKSDVLYKRIFKKRTVLAMIAASWIMASAPPVAYLLSGNRFTFNSGRTICYPDARLLGPRIYLHCVYAIFIVVPSCVMFYCYYNVFRTIRLHSAQVANSVASENSEIALRSFARESRVTKMLFATLVGFELCWAPLYILELIDLLGPQVDAPRAVYVMTTLTVTASSSINPVIYTVMNKEFRDTFKNLFFCS